MLDELHEIHPGMCRMKALARDFTWWPGMDVEIEEMVRHCDTCQKNQTNPGAAPSHPWEYARAPWERLHIDHGGPVGGKLFLVVVDSYSKWVEAEIVSSTSSEVTIATLRKLFATHGLPAVIVSDNAPGFSSEEMASFMSRNGIRHVFSAPYHPASNGQAEATVKKVKAGLLNLGEGDIETRVCRILFRDHITPQTTTGHSPAELLFNRRLRSALTLLRPNVGMSLRAKQVEEMRKTRTFQLGDAVLSKNFGRGEQWLPGIVAEVLGQQTT